MNKTLNIYKWLLFISKTKEEFFKNIYIYIKRPDGSPAQFTDEMKERLFENSKQFQLFIILLELCRTKYKNVDFDNIENMRKFEKMRSDTINMYVQEISNALIEQEKEKETEKETEKDIENKVQKGSGLSQNNLNNLDNIDFNRYRIAKLCYTLDNPFPLKIPTVEFLNFKFSNNNNLNFA